MIGKLTIESISKTCGFKYSTKCDLQCAATGTNFRAIWHTPLSGNVDHYVDQYELSVSEKIVVFICKFSNKKAERWVNHFAKYDKNHCDLSLTGPLDEHRMSARRIINHVEVVSMLDTNEVGDNETLSIKFGKETLILLKKNLKIDLFDNGFKVLGRAYFKKKQTRTAKFNVSMTGEYVEQK